MTHPIQDIYRRESAGLLHYLRQAEPYARPSEKERLSQIFSASEKEAATLERLAIAMTEGDLPTPSVAFPMAFTGLNYLDIRSLLPRLLTQHRADLTALERVRPSVPAGPWDGELDTLLKEKREHLGTFESWN